jgi:hypothetical protein
MVKILAVVGVGLSLVMALMGCSVGMAMSGKEDPNLGAFRVGSTRGEVELQLGRPLASVTNPEGSRSDVYEYEIGNKPSPGRAIAHGVMDVLTLGLWEVVGTPIEAFQGEKYRMTVRYDAQDRVVAINQSPVPAQPAAAPVDAAQAAQGMSLASDQKAQ